MSELKKCPFCGGEASVEYDLGVYAVVCRECDASSRTEDDWHVGDSAYADVVAAWNRRADGWIPVTEEMPDYGVDVLVAVIQADGSRTIDIDVMDEVNAFAGSYSHWMPLPEPPKGATTCSD